MPDSFGHPLQLPQILAGFGIDSVHLLARDGRRARRGRGRVPVALAGRQRGPRVPAAAVVQQLQRCRWWRGGAGRADRRPFRGRADASGRRQPSFSATATTTAASAATCRPCAPISSAACPARASRSRATPTTWPPSTPENLPAYTGELLGSRHPERVARGQLGAPVSQAGQRARRTPAARGRDARRAPHASHRASRFPASDFRLAWRQLLKCHPHDSICGCSCDEVHRDMLVRYEQLERTVAQLERRALERVRRRYARRGRRRQPPALPAARARRGSRSRADGGRARWIQRPARRAGARGEPQQGDGGETRQRDGGVPEQGDGTAIEKRSLPRRGGARRDPDRARQDDRAPLRASARARGRARHRRPLQLLPGRAAPRRGVPRPRRPAFCGTARWSTSSRSEPIERSADRHHGRAAGRRNRPSRVPHHDRQRRRRSQAPGRVPGRTGGGARDNGPRRGTVRGRPPPAFATAPEDGVARATRLDPAHSRSGRAWAVSPC